MGGVVNGSAEGWPEATALPGVSAVELPARVYQETSQSPHLPDVRSGKEKDQTVNMNDPKDRARVRQMADAISKKLSDEGKLIAGGWAAFVIMARLQDAPEIQLTEMRRAFMGGAQHLFASIMTILDPGQEATDRDLQRVDLIHQELLAYVEELKDEVRKRKQEDN